MQRRRFILVVTLWHIAASAQSRSILKIAALSSGELRADGKAVDLAILDRLLAELKQKGGEVWYYRENAATEPTAQAIAAIQLVVKHSLPITMSTKSDFSDHVDAQGNSRPRT